MTNKKILVTAGNTNTNSFKGICYAVKMVLGDIIAVHIFDSPQSAKQADSVNRSGIIRSIFGSIDIRTSEVTDEDIQTIVPERISTLIQEFGVNNILVDLSNGQKITASVLYAIATISRIPNIYVLNAKVRLTPDTELEKLKYHDEWDYLLVEPLQGLTNISRSSFVELVYYRDRIDELAKILINQNYTFGSDTRDRLNHALVEYFSVIDEKNAEKSVILERCVSGLGLICEDATNHWHMHCKSTGIITTDASNFNAQIEQIEKTWNTFRSQIAGEKLKRTHPQAKLIFSNLNTDSLLAAMQKYRNLASHKGGSYQFSKLDARLGLDLTLLILEKLAGCDVFTFQDDIQ